MVQLPKFLIPASIATVSGGVALDMIGNTLQNAYPDTPHRVWLALFWFSVMLFMGLPVWLMWRIFLGTKIGIMGLVSRWRSRAGVLADRQLYVGQINVSTNKLASESILEISLLCFNGSNHPLEFDHIEGNIILNLDGRNEESLPPCQFAALHWTIPVLPFQEFNITLTQRLSLVQAAALTQALGNPEKGPDMRFKHLGVFLRSARKPKLAAKVPLWGGIRLTQQCERIWTNKIISGEGNITL